jgi:hypothetical protein
MCIPEVGCVLDAPPRGRHADRHAALRDPDLRLALNVARVLRRLQEHDAWGGKASSTGNWAREGPCARAMVSCVIDKLRISNKPNSRAVDNPAGAVNMHTCDAEAELGGCS